MIVRRPQHLPTGPLSAAAIVVAAVLSVFAITASQSAERNTRVIHDAAIGQCRRVQTLRNRVNADSAELYDIGSVLTAIVAERSLLAVLSGPDRRLRLRATARLRADLARLRYAPPSDCPAAVEHPLRYRPPPGRPFRSGG